MTETFEQKTRNCPIKITQIAIDKVPLAHIYKEYPNNGTMAMKELLKTCDYAKIRPLTHPHPSNPHKYWLYLSNDFIVGNNITRILYPAITFCIMLLSVFS